jgi:hypothetical protein
MTKPPPWHARDAQERQMMIEWVNSELDRQLKVETDQRMANFDQKEFRDWCAEYGSETFEAEHGNIEPLRKRLPKLAKFLHLPKQEGPGKRFPKLGTQHKHNVRRAVNDVDRIRALWRQQYKKQNRGKDVGIGPSAEDIAAERWGVTVDEILTQKKKSRAK